MSHQKDIYNHETNLTRVNSFNNICFKFRIDKSIQTRQFRGNTANACMHLTWWFTPCTSIFPQNLLVCPKCRVRGTYIHLWIFFCSKMKKGFKITSRAKFGRLNVYISSKLLSSQRKYKFYPELSHGDMYNKRYMSPGDQFGLS